MVVGPVSVLGVGIDLVEIPRVRRMLERRGERALARFLTDHEREYVLSRPDPVPHIAARLAAKEAVYKALQELPGCRGVGWREIEVSRDGSGRPSATLSGLAERAVALAGGARIHLSLSHSHRAASAVAVLERIAGSGEPG